MKAAYEDLLQTATQRLVAEFQPEEIYLFGSHAWGTPGPDSDIDLMVIVPQSDERPIRRDQRAQRCLGRLLISADVLVRTVSSARPKTPRSTPPFIIASKRRKRW